MACQIGDGQRGCTFQTRLRGVEESDLRLCNRKVEKSQ